MESQAYIVIEEFLARASDADKPYFSGLIEAVEEIRRIASLEGESAEIKMLWADNPSIYGVTAPEAILGYLHAIRDIIEYLYCEKLYLANSLASELEGSIAASKYFSAFYCTRALLELAADINYHLGCCTFKGKVDLDYLAEGANVNPYLNIEEHIVELTSMPPSSVRRLSSDKKLSAALYAHVASILKKCGFLLSKTRTNWSAFLNEARWGDQFDDKSVIQEATNVLTTIKYLRFSGPCSDVHKPMHYYYILSDYLHPAFGQSELVTANASVLDLKVRIPGFSEVANAEVHTRVLKSRPKGSDIDDKHLKIILYPAARSLSSIINSIARLRRLSEQLQSFSRKASRDAGIRKTMYETIRDGSPIRE